MKIKQAFITEARIDLSDAGYIFASDCVSLCGQTCSHVCDHLRATLPLHFNVSGLTVVSSLVLVKTF